MDEKLKKDMTRLINQGFEEVMLPALDDLKDELSDKINDLEVKLVGRVDRLERKMDKVITSDLDQDDLLDGHDKRIKKLEKHPAVA